VNPTGEREPPMNANKRQMRKLDLAKLEKAFAGK
jgi:hypothetical protein